MKTMIRIATFRFQGAALLAMGITVVTFILALILGGELWGIVLLQALFLWNHDFGYARDGSRDLF